MSAAVTDAGAGLDQLELHRVRGVALEAQLLDVEDDRVTSSLTPGMAAELVVDVADLDGGHGGTLERRQQDAAQGVAERHAVAGRQRAGLVLGVLGVGSPTDSICGFSSSIIVGDYLE